MITIDAALSDLKKISDKSSSIEVKAIMASTAVVLKFLSTMRSNQLLTEEDKKELKAKKNELKKK